MSWLSSVRTWSSTGGWCDRVSSGYDYIENAWDLRTYEVYRHREVRCGGGSREVFRRCGGHTCPYASRLHSSWESSAHDRGWLLYKVPTACLHAKSPRPPRSRPLLRPRRMPRVPRLHNLGRWFMNVLASAMRLKILKCCRISMLGNGPPYKCGTFNFLFGPGKVHYTNNQYLFSYIYGKASLKN